MVDVISLNNSKFDDCLIVLIPCTWNKWYHRYRYS